MAWLSEETKTWGKLGGAGCVCIWIVIILITVFASIRVLGVDEQIVVDGPEGKYVINGPKDLVQHPFRKNEHRKAIRITERQYAVLKDSWSGLYRHEAGPQLLFMGAWETLVEMRGKVTLQQKEYMRLINELTGYERVVKGPALFVPDAMEEAPNGTEIAQLISQGRSMLTVNKSRGVRKVTTTPGLFYPEAYEEIIALRLPIVVAPMEYVVVKVLTTGALRNVNGPMQLKLGAYEELQGGKQPKIMLTKDEYIVLVNGLTGVERVIRGPSTLVPEPAETSKFPTMKQRAIHVSATKGVLTIKSDTGVQTLVTQEGVFVPAPYEQIIEQRPILIIGFKEYIVIQNTMTGLKRVVSGNCSIFIKEYEELLEREQKLELKKGFYVVMVNRQMGTERVIQGPQPPFAPQPDEYAPAGIQEAIFVDKSETALLVLDRATGVKELIRTDGAYIPPAYQVILEERKLVVLTVTQNMIVRNNEGDLTVVSGSAPVPVGESRGFFLKPEEDIVPMHWSSFSSSGDDSALATETITRIDMSQRSVFFRFKVRTKDNVRLSLEGRIYWKVSDCESLVANTGDPEGDIWYNSRGALIKAVSRATFENFMGNSSAIALAAFQQQATGSFYSQRGIQVLNMDLTKYTCTDPAIDDIRRSIIEETTNRINRLQEAASSVDVKLSTLAGQLIIEQSRASLLNATGANEILQARMDGEAFGRKELESVKGFLDGLNSAVPKTNDRVAIFKLKEQLRGRTTDLQNLMGSKNTKLYMGPKDMNVRMDMTAKTPAAPMPAPAPAKTPAAPMPAPAPAPTPRPAS